MYRPNELVRLINGAQIARLIGEEAFDLYNEIVPLMIYKNKYDGKISLRGLIIADDLYPDDVIEYLRIFVD